MKEENILVFPQSGVNVEFFEALLNISLTFSKTQVSSAEPANIPMSTHIVKDLMLAHLLCNPRLPRCRYLHRFYP